MDFSHTPLLCTLEISLFDVGLYASLHLTADCACRSRFLGITRGGVHILWALTSPKSGVDVAR